MTSLKMTKCNHLFSVRISIVRDESIDGIPKANEIFMAVILAELLGKSKYFVFHER